MLDSLHYEDFAEAASVVSHSTYIWGPATGPKLFFEELGFAPVTNNGAHVLYEWRIKNDTLTTAAISSE